jgi:protein phosphatase
VLPSNEDNFHIARFGRYFRTAVTSLPAAYCPVEVDRAGYAFVVTDGVGSRPGGAGASRRAITLLVEFILLTPDWILGLDDDLLAIAVDRMAERFRRVNAAVVAEAQGQTLASGTVTTLSLALTLGHDLLVAHVGDSPVCLFRRGRLIRLTRAHAVEVERAGFDATVETRYRHVLTRAIGLADTGSQPDIECYRLADGDRLLLCTNGLTDLVDDETIARELGRGTSSNETCQALVDLALERGGKDNVTVVVATYRIEKPW